MRKHKKTNIEVYKKDYFACISAKNHQMTTIILFFAVSKTLFLVDTFF